MAYGTVLVEDFKVSGEIMLDTHQKSWITSLVTITVPIGSFVTGPLMDRFGRKTMCLVSCVPAIISWILLITGNSLTLIYISRCIAGFGSGLTTVVLIYVSEITHPRIRPMMLCCNSVFVSLGILVTFCLTFWLSWLKIAIVFLLINCFITLGLFFIPESPYWYLCFDNGMTNAKRVRKAEKSLKWLNRREKIYDSEYSRIKEISQEQKSTRDETLLQKLKYLYVQVCLPTAYKPLTIMFFLFLLQQLSGCYVVIFYAISILKKLMESSEKSRAIKESDINIYGALVLLGTVRFTMSIVTAWFSKIYGRRTLCIISGLGMAFSMFFSGMYMYLTSYWDEKGNFKVTMAGQQWTLIIIILAYVLTSSIGFMVIPWTLSGELLPISLRGIGSGIMVSVAYVIMFGVIKAYLYVLEAIGAQGIFFFFSFMSLVGTGFIYLFLPETLGKSFSEIERYFDNGIRKEKGKEINPDSV
ncbi:facilitated trehalose transporter Tret1-like isoform X2 [Belonocnema kinseyi]|nr:facilitated trehalose transporter Tret1-like isoform X2 [Belonocnema kinseyi]XP_033218807.1 facilitated trehalose transporter Tret1-like isoform X2 [Belonocnema kinseyi]